MILLAINCVFIVREGQTGILLQFGRIVESGYKPGLHFKIPLMQQALRFDSRLQTLDAAAERYLTSEKKDVNVDFVVKWKISDPTTLLHRRGRRPGSCTAATRADGQGRHAHGDQFAHA